MSIKTENLYNKKPIEVAIIGYGTIGRVHGKILNKLGAKIVGVTCSTPDTVDKASTDIYHSFGNKPFTSTNSDYLIKRCKPDCVFICTPPEQHLDNIINALKYEIPIFCEKPLIWNKKFTKDDFNKHLEFIKSSKNRKLFCNFANNNLLKLLIKKACLKEDLKFFKFLFYTHGIYENKEIAIDLLPHGIAMLTYLIGFEGNIKKYTEKYERHKFICNFYLNDAEIEFEFAQSSTFDRKFKIQFNDRVFERKIMNEDGLYKVWFDEHKTNNRYPMENPFEIEVKEFLRYVKTNSTIANDKFIDAYYNTKILTDLLLNEEIR